MEELFIQILNQMIYLFAFIAVGFVFGKCKFIPDNSATVLSKLENFLFLPMAVMVIFITDCTPEKIMQSWQIILGSVALILLLIPLSLGCGKLCYKEKYVQNIAAYGLNFSNFAFMGLAVAYCLFRRI